MKPFLVYYLIINTITFIVWGYDKLRAIKGSWRVRESTLVGFCLRGGCFGAGAGMMIFHHKIRKPKIQILVILTCLIHFAILFTLR